MSRAGAGPLRGPAGRLLPRGPGPARRCSCARPRWRRRCCSSSSARSSSATRGRCCASSCPGRRPSYYEHARERHLDDYPDLALTEAKRIDALVGIQAPGDVRELAGVDPDRIARYARARRPIREATMKKRWCSTLWPTEALAAPGGHGRSRTSRPSCAARCSSTSPTRCAAWGGLRAFQERLIARLRDARELRLEAEGTDLTLSVAGRTWVNSDGKRNMPSGEVFTGPHEHSANGRVRFTVRSAPAGIDVDGVELELRDGEVVSARAERRRRLPAARAGHRRRLALPGRDRHRHQLRHRAPDGHDPLRREDRRHRPSRARALVSGDRRQEPLRAALGPHLRPARRRAAERRRRGRAGGRALRPVEPPASRRSSCSCVRSTLSAGAGAETA